MISRACGIPVISGSTGIQNILYPPSAGHGWLGSYFESLSECLSLSPSFFILKILPSSVGLGLTFFGESIIKKHKNTKLTKIFTLFGSIGIVCP